MAGSTPASAIAKLEAVRKPPVNLNSPGYMLGQVLRSPSGFIGTAIVLLLVFCAVFADQIAPHSPQAGELMDSRRPPAWMEGGTWDFPLGTDQLGQDILSRIIHGARVSLLVGFFGVAIALSMGLVLGMLAGYFGGWVDSLVMAYVNLILSVPYLVIVIVIAAVFGRSLLNVVIIFGFTDAPIFIRLARSETMRIRQEEYVHAAMSLGGRSHHLILKHILPNLIGAIITLATFEMSAMIFYESGLSFLGLSVPPEVPSWGNMIAQGRRFFTIYPWMAIYPGLAIAITALGVNFLGDRLRDVLDPRLRR